MKIKNETEIQLMKILYKSAGGKSTKNVTSRRAYPHGTESKYFRQLKSFFKPLTDYVNKYIEQHSTELLRGDSSTMHIDAVLGDSFRDMISNLNNWVEMYMPEIGKDTESSTNNFILKEIKKTADDVLDFDNNDFSKMVHKGINVDVPITSQWWNDMRNSWAEDNYSLIVSNAKNYISKINTLTEQAVVNGFSVRKLTGNIKEATTGLTDKHCKLLARDQIGKLNGQITESQMQEIGLELYVWSTSNDDRVRESHAIMEGLLCRWDDASVCSYDNGKTWVDRPAGAVDLHPGQDIQCRCVPLAFFPELTAEVEGKELVELTEDLPPVEQKEIPEDVAQSFYSNGVETKNENFKSYVMDVFSNTDPTYSNVMNKLAIENKKSINFIDNPKKTSYFSPELKKVFVTHIDDQNVLRHEMGHFFDDAMGKNTTIHLKGTDYSRKEKLTFSLTSNFKKTYEKEVKGMVKKLYDDSVKIGRSADTAFSLNRYLSQKYPDMDMHEKTIIHDMFTAVKKKSYGGHSVSYFRRNNNWNELKNAGMFHEGFAELCESYSGTVSKQFRDFLKENFSESIPIIDKAMEDYLKRK